MAYQAGNTFVFGEQPTATKWDQLWRNDDAIYGFMKVIQHVGTNFTSVATGTTTIPNDDTIPQNTEGDEYMTQAITPTSATNILIVESAVWLSPSVSINVVAALFQDTTANALAVSIDHVDSGSEQTNVWIQHRMTAGTTSSTTFKIRAGGVSAGTTTFNGQGGARRYGAINKSNINIYEIKV